MYLRLSIFTAILIVAVACGGGNDESEGGMKMPALDPKSETELFNKAKSIFGTLPEQMPGAENDTPAEVELGKKLYFETALSINNTQSCNTCHNIEGGAGVDGKRVSPGAIEGKEGRRNSPTVFNAGFHFAQFWDGREKDLVGQAKGPILNPDEMALESEEQAVERIKAIEEYHDMFKAAYPDQEDPITYQNIAEAIAAFERTLISKAKFDEYVEGNQDALSNAEKRGLKMFIETGCITCHTGPNFGGTLYQKMGLVNAYENKEDMGRFEVTGVESDKYMFKVASLRNVELTAPYYHDGAVEKLEDAVQKMAWMNLGKELTPTDIDQIVAFLKTLTDPKLKNTDTAQN